MVWIGFFYGGDNGLFRQVVDITDKIIILFSNDFDPVEPIHVANNNVAGSTRSAYRNI
jgi:hypothetical protein